MTPVREELISASYPGGHGFESQWNPVSWDPASLSPSALPTLSQALAVQGQTELKKPDLEAEALGPSPGGATGLAEQLS